MPVRSLRSSVMRWPDRQTVDGAVRAWATRLAEREPELVAVGYFGSYARNEAGVGSDLDLVVLVRSSGHPRERRAARWDLEQLPVPAEALVYTWDEWRRLSAVSPKLHRTLVRETVWVLGRPPDKI